jgi:hypothetical protein
LKLVEEQEDKSAIFRVCVNLGNMYFILEQFNKAIAVRNKVGQLFGRLQHSFHHSVFLQLLTLVKETGDKPAMSRVLSKLGNAHARLGEVNRALDYYRYVEIYCRGKRKRCANHFAPVTQLKIIQTLTHLQKSAGDRC